VIRLFLFGFLAVIAIALVVAFFWPLMTLLLLVWGLRALLSSTTTKEKA
jgi:hypothetical protein